MQETLERLELKDDFACSEVGRTSGTKVGANSGSYHLSIEHFQKAITEDYHCGMEF